MAEPEHEIRPVREDEIKALLDLYRHLHRDDAAPPAGATLRSLWARIFADPALHYLVAEHDGRLVASCTLALIPNLTRGGRPYGLIENVVTHPDVRRRGFGSALLRRAQQIAWDSHCYKVMLMTGSKADATLDFYRKSGFDDGEKTGFIARAPDSPPPKTSY